MERNRKKKGESSRARLLEAAMRQFAEKGYRPTKVSDIVKAAGLTQAAFYLYFPSKEAILSELAAEYKERLNELANAGRLVTPLQKAEAPMQVKENLRSVLRFFHAHPQLTRIALFESPDGEAMKRDIHAMIAQNLRSNQQAGLVRSGLPVETAAECIVAVIELTVKKLLAGEALPEQLADETADVVSYGILAQ
ncbi:TetR/AcrR family transcriptional regulator [Paenibacillus thermotolerans]|uniref:TetR/AcrR family transcriptional regulator n=1 Tax=Paenibacillus thermotolerans TaxID=3027807 RepID=UPI002367FF0D|nr:MULTISPECIES: TetR/AcrR family transcriptional regulator [unclassified Paenibacillus]